MFILNDYSSIKNSLPLYSVVFDHLGSNWCWLIWSVKQHTNNLWVQLNKNMHLFYMFTLTLFDDRFLRESFSVGNNPMANGDHAIKPTPAICAIMKITHQTDKLIYYYILTNFVVQFGHVNLYLLPAKHMVFGLF